MTSQLNELYEKQSAILNKDGQLTNEDAHALYDIENRIEALKSLQHEESRLQDAPAHQNEYQESLVVEKNDVLANTSASERTEEQQSVIDAANAEQNRVEEAQQWGDERYFAIVDDKNDVKCVPESEYNEWRNDRQQEAFQDVTTGADLKAACQNYKIDVDELQHDMFLLIDELKQQPGDHQQELDACRNTVLDGMDQKDDLKNIATLADDKIFEHVVVEIENPENLVAEIKGRMSDLYAEKDMWQDKIDSHEIEMER